MDVKVKVVCPDCGHTDRFGEYSEDSQFQDLDVNTFRCGCGFVIEVLLTINDNNELEINVEQV